MAKKTSKTNKANKATKATKAKELKWVRWTTPPQPYQLRRRTHISGWVGKDIPTRLQELGERLDALQGPLLSPGLLLDRVIRLGLTLAEKSINKRIKELQSKENKDGIPRRRRRDDEQDGGGSSLGPEQGHASPEDLQAKWEGSLVRGGYHQHEGQGDWQASED